MSDRSPVDAGRRRGLAATLAAIVRTFSLVPHRLAYATMDEQ